jgi:L-malate glycosyltransferase
LKIIQLVPAVHTGDAIGNDALTIRNYFRSRGFFSEIICLQADAELSTETHPPGKFSQWDSRDTVTILHYALPSMLNGIFSSARGCRILVYHNITPPEFLMNYPQFQRLAILGRAECKRLAECTHFGLADSEFNRRELANLGFKNTSVMPIFIDFEAFDGPVNPVLMEMFKDDFTNFLFVGRLTPNKCQHDLIRLYGFYKRFVRERSRLFLVGKWDGFEPYYIQLMKMASDLKLGDVYITGKVDESELVTYYRVADVFVSMSEHEGFGVPLVESMYFGVPVVAYEAGATPFTLGGAGVLFKDKTHWLELAELLGLIAGDSRLRSRILSGQERRLNDFSREIISKRWDELIADAV